MHIVLYVTSTCLIFLIVLYIDGDASVVTYQAILRNVDFYIGALEPDTIDRTICFFVYDGKHTSDPACVKLKIQAINDNTPSLNATALGEPYVEGTDSILLLESLEVIDDDHPYLFPMQQATVSLYCILDAQHM